MPAETSQQTANVQPQQATPHALNPYASPLEAGGYDATSQRGVGVWRDDNLLVIHKEAVLPLISIHSGEPATCVRKFRLVWSYPIDWSTRSLDLDLPVTEQEYRRYSWRLSVSWLALLVPVTISLALAVLVGVWPDWLFTTVILCNAVGVVVCWAIQSSFFKPIVFVRVRDKYLWIKGFDSRFLAQLPEWNLSD